MKTVFLILLLVTLPACAFLKRSGEVVCNAQGAVAEGVDTAGGYLGGPGKLAATIVNVVLEMGCRIYKAIVAIPSDIADGPGDSEKEAKDAPESTVHEETHQ